MDTKIPRTPLMQQYFQIKKQFSDALLLFQVGDFYELFYEDAQQAAAFLAIALTSRGKDGDQPIPLCGVPMHAADHYITKLIKGGFKVAVCDQLEPAVPGKLVQRAVVRVLTPGTLTETNLLDAKQACYLLSFFPYNGRYGLLFAELLTAQLFATVLHENHVRDLDAELCRFLPSEILLPNAKEINGIISYFQRAGYPVSKVDFFNDVPILDWVSQQFCADTRQKFMQQKALLYSCANLYGYLQHTKFSGLHQFKHVNFYDPHDYLLLDSATQRNLELVRNMHDGNVNNTLFATLDNAVTAMGSRTIRKWIMRPLVDQETIVKRQDVIQTMIDNVAFVQQLKKLLQEIGDIERVIGRICLARGQLHDYQLLCRCLSVLPTVVQLLNQHCNNVLLASIYHQLGDFTELYELLRHSLNHDATKDWIINQQVDERLDRARTLVDDTQMHIAALEQALQTTTNIGSLKIRYTPLHGYYIEITKANAALVPTDFQRLQSLVGKERYTTQQLKQLQAEIMAANNQIGQLENEIFERIKQQVREYAVLLRKMAHALSMLDALVGLSICAYERGYIRPIFNTQQRIVISNGKHPVLAQLLGQHFVANDVNLDDQESMLIITGPNMGGKSTYLRQVALLVIMAQIGSFVPSESAEVSICDKIFTRIGASDNVAAGKSTFLMEMEETANICLQATSRSLIILDEVGRGTSTFDGFAIAQAVIEYICTTIKARCLFATHYHELTQLSQRFNIVPYFALCKKNERGIVFLHKIIRGIADGSFGIEVARLAQLPHNVINRAEEILQELQENKITFAGAQKISMDAQEPSMQLANSHEQQKQKEKEYVLQQLTDIDYDQLSPKKAFDILWQIKERLINTK